MFKNLIGRVDPVEDIVLQPLSGLSGLVAADLVQRVVGLALQHVLLVRVRLAAGQMENVIFFVSFSSLNYKLWLSHSRVAVGLCWVKQST